MKTLSEQNEQLTADLLASQALANEANETISALRTEIETLSGFKATSEKLSAEVETLKASLIAKGEEFDALTLAAKSAEDRALEIAAGQGIPPLNLNSETTTSESLNQQFQKIQDPAERTEFWRKNKNALLKEGK